MSSYTSAGDIIESALQELGLGTVSLAAGAADSTGYQILGLLNSLGDELLRTYDWPLLLNTVNLVGDGSDTFQLPADFGRQVNQTQWATQDKRPMQGPSSPQVWAWNQYGVVAIGTYYQYRFVANQMQVYPTPAAGTEFSFYYMPKNWVLLNGDLADPRERVTTANDTVLFDRRLMVAGLKLKFWAAKGFDTTILQKEFDYMLSSEKSQTQGAPVLDLCGPYVAPLLGWGNVTDGGWG